MGIDISSWQRGMPASAMASTDFAILKISEGKSWNDPAFEEFYGMTNLKLGAYVYSHATSEAEAVAEAQHALDILRGRYLPLGVFIDVEEEKQLCLPNLTQICEAFCSEIRAGGYLAGAYGSAGQLWARVDPCGFSGLVWAASWGAEPRFSCDIWQYSCDERLPGYKGPVDGDRAMSERFIALVNGEEQKEEEPTEAYFSIDRVPVLQYGDTGDAVKALQGELIAYGYSCGGKKDWRGAEKPDGIFGNITKASVEAFQRSRNLTDNGIAGPKTRAALVKGATE